MGGGVVSLSFKVMILVFLCVKILAVVSYKDPQISGYAIFEQRAHMQELQITGGFSSIFNYLPNFI